MSAFRAQVRVISTHIALCAIGVSLSGLAHAAPTGKTAKKPTTVHPAPKNARTAPEPPPPAPAAATPPTEEPALDEPKDKGRLPASADDSRSKARTAPQEDDPKEPSDPARTTSEEETKPAEPVSMGGAPVSEDDASSEGGKLHVHPYLLVSGGLKADFVKARPNEIKNDRVSTFALGRIGLKARFLDFLSAESEFMASGGVGLHGTSAYEGQAAMQVRQQVIRLTKWGFRGEVGRIIDEASMDYFSAHVAESFIQDTATRDALLFTGFNLGNGIRGTYEIFPGLRAGFTFNAGNPVSNTASLLIGGPYPPFDRFYTQPYQQVNQSANNFPDDAFHSMVFTPSVLVDTKHIDTRLAAQLFDINTNTNSDVDDHIRGYNLRGTMRVKLLDRMVVPFAGAAYTRNDTLVPTNLALRANERYHAVNVGGGVDLNLQRRFKCSHDCADGVGAQYQQVQFQIGDSLVTTQRYVNVGSTYWLSPNVSLGLRFAMWTQEAEQPVTPAGVAAGQTRPEVHTQGERSVIAALRFIMP
jgi:hypothetical protein